MNIKHILPLVVLPFLVACSGGDKTAKKEVMIKDYNIIIAPDLSNRINMMKYPKPLHDTLLIREVIDHADDLLKLNDRSSGQSDIYKIDFINRGILNSSSFDPKKMTIDFSQFGSKQLDRSNYIRKELNSDKQEFADEVNRVYDYSLQNQTGADVWNYFNETIKTSLVDVSPQFLNETTNAIVNKKNTNVVLLLTDGYIESANQGKGYKLGPEMIEKIRKAFNASGKSELQEFIVQDSSYAINKTNFNLKDANIFIAEMVDRSLDKYGVSKVQPTDFQIIKVIWEKWLKDSGASNVKVIQAVNTKQQFYKEFEQFLKML
ncbi:MULTISPECIES: hypothetical protein [unclassified Sphingobacterium]|uniref:hypothetical protein n=1 Tax=unclassified Sphingobacterium TaxID=2609468 RepID=UPI001042ACAC|nr:MULTISPECIES: hypothetical protein [unclassified Sphingobacterium]MCS3557265.1 hypothetical protein [Sphingobacterium sp. JUb21]TCQ96821.1 hypothetical protein EDF66_12046 [Sphingobacterium sp. JUb20]